MNFHLSDFHNPTCAGYPNDGTATINVNSQYPYTIAWEQGNQCCIPPYLTGNTLNNAAPYEYSFGVFDANGVLTCGSSIRFDCCYKNGGGLEPEPNMTVPSFTSTQVVYTSDNQSCDGAINFTHNMLPTQTNLVTTVKMPEGIVLENSQNLCVGQYCITLNNGCYTKTECFEVKSCEEFGPQVTANITHTCPGYAAGSISLNLEQVATPYSIQWQNGNTGSNLSILGEGSYCVTVTDAHLCTYNQCYDITSSVNVVRDNNCHIFCNGIDVDNKNPTHLGDFLESDCRFRRKYCSDGYEIEPEDVGVKQVIIDAENCILQDYCYNGERYGPQHGGIKETKKVGQCTFELRCAGTFIKYETGTMEYNVERQNGDPDNMCLYGLVADICTYKDLEYWSNVRDMLTYEKICPIPPEYANLCSSQGNNCLYKFYNNGNFFYQECGSKTIDPVNCYNIDGWLEEFLNTFAPVDVPDFRSKQKDYVKDDYSKRELLVRASPNPFSKNINLELIGDWEKVRSIDIFNQLGTRMSIQVPYQIIGTKYYISFDDIQSGMYYIQVTDDVGNTGGCKLIKVK